MATPTTYVGTQKKTNQPAILSKAADLAGDLGAPMGDTDRERIAKYRAQPLIDQAEDQLGNINKEGEALGLRFSSDRYKNIAKLKDRSARAVSESVIVPLMERESADRRADIGLMGQIGAQQGQLGIQQGQLEIQQGQFGLQQRAQIFDEAATERRLGQEDRQIGLAERTQIFDESATQRRLGQEDRQIGLAERTQIFNESATQRRLGIEERSAAVQEAQLALQRAAELGQQTGNYIDPETGASYETLQAKLQAAEIDLRERAQSLSETNSAMERAAAHGEATGQYTDPVTGQTWETLSQRRLNLNERVARAAETGFWDEEATLDALSFLESIGVDISEFGIYSAGAPKKSDDDPPGADDVVQKVTELEAEVVLEARNTVARVITGANGKQIEQLAGIYGDSYTQFLDELEQGNINTYGDISKWIDPNTWGGYGAFFLLADLIDVPGDWPVGPDGFTPQIPDDAPLVWVNGDPALGKSMSAFLQVTGGRGGAGGTGDGPTNSAATKAQVTDLKDRLGGFAVSGRINVGEIANLYGADAAIQAVWGMDGIFNEAVKSEITKAIRGESYDIRPIHGSGMVLTNLPKQQAA